MYLHIKRGLDILLSVLGIIVASPFLLIIAIAIKIDSRGPVLFKQERLGLHGKVFLIYKFRSMCVGAESMGSGQYSFKGDSRVTRVGNFIRLTSLDEVPQLFNILEGEMSFIGPRPPLTYHPHKWEDYTEEQKKRFEVRPGITGMAQVHGRKSLDWDERIRYDNEYVDTVSFGLDFKLFWLTIYKVFAMEDNKNVTQTATAEGDKHAETHVHNQ